MVGFTGQNKSIGYWGVFFLSLILSPLIGLIIGLASGPKVMPQVQRYTCGKCKIDYTGRPANCPHCNTPVIYADTIYTCTKCTKPFKGQQPNCPHCATPMLYS